MSEVATMLKPCACGKIHRVETEHYERLLLVCADKQRRAFWSIRRQRNGPLELRPWPGPPFAKAGRTVQ